MEYAPRWYGVTLDCVDPVRVAAFWGAWLGVDVGTDDDLPGWRRLQPGDGLPRINFQPVAEPKQSKVRVHLDFQVDDLDAAVARIQHLGGSFTGERHDYDVGVVLVMADPEGTEFCLAHLFDQGERS